MSDNISVSQNREEQSEGGGDNIFHICFSKQGRISWRGGDNIFSCFPRDQLAPSTSLPASVSSRRTVVGGWDNSQRQSCVCQFSPS